MKKRWKIVCLVLLACGLLYLHDQYHLTTEEILSWQPESPAFWQALILNITWIALSGLGFGLFYTDSQLKTLICKDWSF